MVELSVVQLHEGRPLLNDVTGRLRLLADQIEAGEYGEEVSFAYIILDSERPVPALIGFGELPSDRYILGLLDIAKEWFMREIFKAEENLP